MKKKCLMILLLLPFAATAAQGYKIVHPDGTVEYTDQPVRNAEEINLPGAQGYQSSGQRAAPVKGTAKATAVQNGNGAYTQFAITSPAAEESIPNSGGIVSISVSVSPVLKQGDQVVISLDGTEVARGQATTFTLSEVGRGQHLVGASIVDSAGTAVGQANPVTFYVFQQSLLNPNNPNNPNSPTLNSPQ